MTTNNDKAGSGPPIDFEIRDRKGRSVQSFAVPETQAAAFFAALATMNLQPAPKYDPYGDTVLPHEVCKQISAAWPSIRATRAGSIPAGVSVILEAIGRVGSDPGFNLFVIGN